MRIVMYGAALLMIVVLVACSAGERGGEQIYTRIAMLQPRGGTVSGDVLVGPGPRPGTTRAKVALIGSSAGQQHPWHVHSGRCDLPGEIVGGPVQYRMLDIRADGKADVTQTLDFDLKQGVAYYVAIHFSRGAMDLVIACGDLLPL